MFVFKKKSDSGIRKVKTGEKENRKKAGMPWYIVPGACLYERLPKALRQKLYSAVWRYYRYQGKKDQARAEKDCRMFLARQLAVLFWGLTLVLVLAAASFCIRWFSDDSIILRRNLFGQGKKEEYLLLADKEDSKSVSVTVEEQALTPREKEELIRRFFIDLRQNMCGKNESLESVGSSLRFDDELPGYPFAIEYQPRDYSLIDINGELGDEAGRIKEGETARTRVLVTASYGDWVAREDVTVLLTAPKKKTAYTIYDRVLFKLRRLEETSRWDDEIRIPGEIDHVKIGIPGSAGRTAALLILAALCPFLWVIRRYSMLKEEDEKRRRQEAEDFPSIVHLLSLYMKAGLSFSSAVHRISRDCQEDGTAMKRTAYTDIVIMDQQLSMGVSQKEACISWGRRCGHPMYQKLSAAMIQMLVKGSKEGDRIMMHMEREAFEQRIDRARKEGKTAETRLLFPMIILLCLVMVLVLFPAVIRFQGF